jgi:hypothetical protein
MYMYIYHLYTIVLKEVTSFPEGLEIITLILKRENIYYWI